MTDPVVPPPRTCEHGKTYGHPLWNGPFGSPLSQIVDSCPGPVVPLPEQHNESETKMNMYRKRPVEVEARRFDGTPECGAELVAWAKGCGAEAEYEPFLADHFKGDPKVYVAHPDPFMRIKTLEGTMVASVGDWIIRGVEGEFYPCKPGIFEMTYEAVGW